MKFSSRTMPLKAGARVNTTPLEAINKKIIWRYPVCLQRGASLAGRILSG